ncbi:MAG: GldG family protein [Clostridiales bacterium]|nr:GldG family protein [Clostridiales bacterium]
MKFDFSTLASKKVRYGSLSTLMIIIVLAVLVVLNLVFERLDLSFDLSSNTNYSLSQESIDIVKNLDKPVTIYALVRTGEEDNVLSGYVGTLTFSRLLREYETNSSNVKVEYRDPYMLPGFAEQFSVEGDGIPIDSVIVQSGEKFKVIKSTEMYTVNYDQNYQPYVESINIETNISNAINYVTSPVTSVLYTITGSNEQTLSENLKRQIDLANYDIKEVNLATSDVPEDCTMLFATQPTRDWTEDEAKKVLAYLQNDGRAIFLVAYYGTEFPNMSSVLQNYGVDLGKYIVIEGNPNNYIVGNPVYILPTIASHAITDPLVAADYMPLMVQASGVDLLDVKKSSTTIEKLLVSSNKAYGKTNLKSTVTTKEAADTTGPFNLAVAITDSVYTNEQHTTKIIVAGAFSMLDENLNNAISGGNWKFLINSMNWLQDKENTIYIAPKTPEEQTTLSMTSSQAFAYAIISVLVLPGLILAAGFYVWFVRRRTS